MGINNTLHQMILETESRPKCCQGLMSKDVSMDQHELIPLAVNVAPNPVIIVARGAQDSTTRLFIHTLSSLPQSCPSDVVHDMNLIPHSWIHSQSLQEL